MTRTAATFVVRFAQCRWECALLVVASIGLSGCRAAPPRYQTTWQRVSAQCHVPTNGYCFGYTPTTWSRYPEECGPHEYVIVEEVTSPTPVVAPPAAVESAPAMESPPAPDPDPIVPPLTDEQIFDIPPPPSAPETPDLEIPSREPEPQSSAPRRLPSWTAHLVQYVEAVTKVR
ncbi:MAG: hypothetical protein SGJ19_01030 [Planctomycetia bacterium]|nr:hypothetical protein [Planctomycetia bacterium]